MARWLVAIAVLLAAVAGMAVVATDAGGQSGVTAELPGAADATANGDHDTSAQGGELGAGAQLTGLVATEDRTVRGRVDRNTFRERLDGAESPQARGALVDRRLSAIDERLGGLERTLDDLGADDENGSGSTGKTTARTAAVGTEAGEIEELLADIEATIRQLPAAEREQRELGIRLTDLAARAAVVRERTRDARRLVDGADSETRAAPITLAEIEGAIQEAVDDADAADRLFGSESIDLRIRRANGSTLRLAVETDGSTITDVRRGSHDDPTVQVYTDYGVVRTLQRTDDVRGAIQDAIAEDRIVYDGTGLYNSVRYGVTDIVDLLIG